MKSNTFKNGSLIIFGFDPENDKVFLIPTSETFQMLLIRATSRVETEEDGSQYVSTTGAEISKENFADFIKNEITKESLNAFVNAVLDKALENVPVEEARN